jgi:hypothetical protein
MFFCKLEFFKGEFDQDVFVLGNNFKTKYEELLEAYNEGQCVMVLIKNVTTASKEDQYLRTQQHTIFTKVVDEAIQVRIFKLHNKLSIVQLALREVNSFLLIFFKTNPVVSLRPN